MFELVKLQLKMQSIKITAIKLHWEKSQLVNIHSNSIEIDFIFTISVYHCIVRQGCIQTLYGLELLFAKEISTTAKLLFNCVKPIY
jgi:hypothetical protein